MAQRKNNPGNPFVASAKSAVEAPILPDLSSPVPTEIPLLNLSQPTQAGAIEYSPAFRQAADAAIRQAQDFYGKEAGFAIRRSGAPARGLDGRPVIQGGGLEGGGGSNLGSVHGLHIISLPDDVATFHTHPINSPGRPSPQDIDEAKRTGKVLMNASREGLWEVGPDGKPAQVFQSRTWSSDKAPR